MYLSAGSDCHLPISCTCSYGMPLHIEFVAPPINGSPAGSSRVTAVSHALSVASEGALSTHVTSLVHVFISIRHRLGQTHPCLLYYSIGVQLLYPQIEQYFHLFAQHTLSLHSEHKHDDVLCLWPSFKSIKVNVLLIFTP